MTLGLVYMILVAQWSVMRAQDFDLKDKGLTDVPSSIPRDTILVMLSKNTIRVLKDYAFVGLPQLQVIEINFNHAETVRKRAFYGTALTELDMNNNMLRTLPYMGDVKSTISTIMIAYNLIEVIQEAHCEGLTNLHKLDLRGNPLRTVPDIRALLPSLTILNVRFIDFACCRSVVHLKDVSSEVIRIGDAPCVYPDAVMDVPWFDVTRSLLEHQTCGKLSVHVQHRTVYNMVLCTT